MNNAPPSARVHRERGAVGAAERAAPEQPQRQHRMRAPALDHEERRDRARRRRPPTRAPAHRSRDRSRSAPSTASRARPRRERAPSRRAAVAMSARDSGTWRSVIATATIASGTLMRNTQRHENVSISQPPTNGPIALATPARPDHAPIARPRSTSWNEEPMIARLPGTSSAPAAPCTAREIASAVASGATAHATLATVNDDETGHEDPLADRSGRRARRRTATRR